MLMMAGSSTRSAIMFVARYTITPEYDVTRNWSAWMGMDFATQEEAYEFVAEQQIDSDTLERKWEKWQDEEHATWHHRNHASWIGFLQDVVDADIRFNEAWGRWQIVHHDGLSCWTLDADTVDSAIVEAQNSGLDWYGFGSNTVGKVEYVCDVPGIEYLRIFKCEDVEAEV